MAQTKNKSNCCCSTYMNPDDNHHSTLAADTFTGRGGKLDWSLSTLDLRTCTPAQWVRSAQLRICAAARRTYLGRVVPIRANL